MGQANRIVKNSFYMYIRMVLLMCISIYSSRILLKELGVTDYGIYNLVGSIVAMFSAIRGLFSASTQRFLNYEMGRGNYEKLKTIFNMSTIVTIIVAIVFVVLSEIIGWWFFNYKINIDIDRLLAAKIVFQLSIVSVFFQMMTSVYDAMIIAHEKMSFYAYMGLFEGVFKLLVIYLLSVFVGIDNLILYACLILLIHIVILIISVIYCRKQFAECRFGKFWNKNYLKQMLSYSGWNMLGDTAYTLTQNGINLVLNTFGGPMVNTARGISYQVNTTLNSFLSNIIVVVRPYTVKKFAEGNIYKVFSTFFLSSKILFFIQYSLALPFVLLTDKIIFLWLGVIPDYSSIFLKAILCYSIIRSLHSPFDILFQATGDIRLYQKCQSVILFLPLPISIICLQFKFPFYCVFILMGLFELINILTLLLIAKRIVSFDVKKYIKEVLMHVIALIILLIAAIFGLLGVQNIWWLILVMVLIYIFLFYYYTLYVLNSDERFLLRNIVLTYIKK